MNYIDHKKKGYDIKGYDIKGYDGTIFIPIEEVRFIRVEGNVIKSWVECRKTTV